MPYFRAMSSAEIPCGTRSYSSISSGGNGDPGDIALEPMGTLVIDSTPPAMVMSHTPDWMRLAAKWIACWLDPHFLSTVVAGVGKGKPAVSHALRATLRLCSPAWVTHPKTTSST